MNCPDCHNEIGRGVNFCPFCGASIIEFHQSYMDGIRYFCEGRYDHALRKMKVACLTDPTNPEILKDCGHAYLHSGNLAGALESYDKSEMLGGNFIDVKYNRALLHLNEHRLDEARLLLYEILGNPPEIKPGQFYLGLIFPDTKHFLAECHLYIGLILKEKNDFETALHHFEISWQNNDEKVAALHNMADLCLNLQKYGLAIEHYHELINRIPSRDSLLDIHINLGRAYYGNGQTDDAIAEFHWALKREPGNPVAIHNLNRIYEQEGILDGARDQKRQIRIVNIREGASPIFGLTEGNLTQNGEMAETESGISIIGRSQGMLRIMRHARLAASSDSTVLIMGENGTGKELLAKAIYYNSPRRDKPFVVVNCAAIPETLLESDLFGHEKGAFTGAYTMKRGRFELADQGTIFLDEIGDISLPLQAKLLRVIQEKEFTRVGGTDTIRVDVRIIAATNRNLKEMIRQGLFREDLFFRLNVIPIQIPPLRDRPDDIPLLVHAFVRKFTRGTHQKIRDISEEEMALLTDYHWPGNVRELENVIERAVVMGTSSTLYLEDLTRLKKLSIKTRRDLSSPDDMSSSEAGIPMESDGEMSLADMEREYIKRVLIHTGGNQRHASRILGINPSTLWRKLKAYGLDLNELISGPRDAS